jgi:hypothetical protein
MCASTEVRNTYVSDFVLMRQEKGHTKLKLGHSKDKETCIIEYLLCASYTL